MKKTIKITAITLVLALGLFVGGKFVNGIMPLIDPPYGFINMLIDPPYGLIK